MARAPLQQPIMPLALPVVPAPGSWWGVTDNTMPGSTGGAPQLVGRSAGVPLGAAFDSRAQSMIGPAQPGVGPGATA